MRSSHLPFWLPIAGLLLPLALGLGSVLLIFGNHRAGAVVLSYATHSDPTGALSIEQAAHLAPDAWQAVGAARQVVISRPATVWFRFTLSNFSDAPAAGVVQNEYRYIDHADLWFSAGSGWTHAQAGQLTPDAAKSLPGRDVAFSVILGPRQTQTVYVRMQDDVGTFARLVWQPAPEYFASRGKRLLAEGLYFGILTALFIYNCLLWLRLRLPGLGWYLLFLAGMAGFIAFARQIPAEAGVLIGSHGIEVLLGAFASLSTLGLAQFSRKFLELARVAPAADHLARVLALCQLGCLGAAVGHIFVPTLDAMAVASAGTAVTHLSIFVIAIFAWRRKVWQARFFILSFGCLFAGSLSSIVTWYHRALTEGAIQGLMLGSALEMLLLSLAVAERFAQAQRDALVAQEHLAAEAEQRRLIEESYADDLELEVKERTRELEEANTAKDRMLSVIGHDLRGPLTGLMRAADETAGDFARDTARTGRNLLLLIEDLVLWARLRAGARALAVHPARNVLAPAVALHNALAEQGGTELLVEADDDLRVETDLVLAQTLVRNLLANALKFARRRVVLRAEGFEGKVRFSVSNDGPTLSPEVAARIAADESGPLTASGGLGLRLCREICRALHLRLEARSSPEFGTEFSFTVNSAQALAPLSP